MTFAPPATSRLFRSLHTPRPPLALANAWDVASARVIEAAGAPAIATTSAGVAWSLGAPDGDALAREAALDLIGRIAAAVAVPVTADIEGGYGKDADDVAETVEGVLAAGAVGVNIEDGTRPPAELAARLAVARRTADRAGADLFLNARVDTYLFGLGDPDTRLRETLDRAHRYVEAGADGVFVPGVTDPAVLTELAGAIPVPLNVMAGPGAPAVAELGALGVARVSLGSGVAQAAYAAARRAALGLYRSGTYDSLTDAIPFPDLNGLLGQGR
ncbi:MULTISPECIES: isocitrate lyase/phosphoenolpyruvate mutase family protein [Streptomyces]|uniref:Isocitrate lyase/phosphoenolpyruvate mutase family protein n=1 Tax=Streptomyces doudnae TaxID=3075536 RepID=A0ABD5F2F5_9ACTN|nr:MULTISPECIES: isocitrate lyase/phosphoenolpyruvate mutase family protein [unclassified Streptomyces]MDT0440049.1 isocitrate lyase/phosphoenolpyruvate mutase family protein [Streptomyces sp. DSM 41981]MYQ67295.1 isocitrate lyase/phosphoenolpyruvate mutase family protein [Streptomyces sp. SID4950]SCE32689.1 2-Methylisocitrate lyase, PEP mutase family [Streptomyces sp. SolWspMP-5a-2]